MTLAELEKYVSESVKLCELGEMDTSKVTVRIRFANMAELPATKWEYPDPVDRWVTVVAG